PDALPHGGRRELPRRRPSRRVRSDAASGTGLSYDLEPAELPDQQAARESGILLSVRGLATIFHTEVGVVHAVDGVSFDVASGEVFAVVGESGSGKTVTALSILGLISEPAGRIVSGEVLYRGEDLVRMDADRRRRIRGDRIAMIFQDPLTALNPVHRVGD